MRLILARHGRTNFNYGSTLLSSTDAPMNKEGLAQVKALAKRLAKEKIDVIYSSPLKRALDTAKAIKKFHKKTKIVIDPDLKELDFGVFECMTREEVAKKYPDLFAAREADKFNYKIPKGESYSQAEVRVKRFLKKISEQGKDAVVVSHGTLMQLFMKNLLQQSFEDSRKSHLSNASFTSFNINNGTVTVELFNSTDHLEKKPKVFFTKIKSYSEVDRINSASEKLLQVCASEAKIVFDGELPAKVHFGEKGNETFIAPDRFEGILSWLREKNPSSQAFFTDTNVLYKGERTFRDSHLAIAKEHGFTQLPLKIADGDHGEEYVEIEIKKLSENVKHFEKCKIGKIIAENEQLLVAAHFKGHPMAGFGGSIKQLAMGCASRGGKLAMHSNSKPILNPLACKKCMTCVKNCPADACIITTIPHIDYKKCIGCATCIAVCPYDAMKINWVGTARKDFTEKIAEYALAATKNKNGSNKKILYVLFALNITAKCDCYGNKFKPIAKDIGVLASIDPVAIDQAAMDLLRKAERKKVFGGDNMLEHGEKIGLGSRKYELIEVKN